MYLERASDVTALLPSMKPLIQGFFPSDYSIEESFLHFYSENTFSELLQKFSQIVEQRLPPDRHLDQFLATAETVVRRALLFQFFQDVSGKRIALLGDDDFTSVALTLLNPAVSVTVFEIDDRIRSTLQNLAKEQSLSITVVPYDARTIVPSDHKGSYDVVFTDPPYTPDGVSLFVSRAVEFLDKTNESSRLYFCYGNSDRAKERFLPIQNFITDSGLLMRWVFDKFNRYTGAESIGSSSSLYVTDITPKTRPVLQGEFHENIYTL
jgi:predicted methyltransferase